MSTPHAATSYPVESTSPYGPPSDTADAEAAHVTGLRAIFDRAKLSAYAQFRMLASIPEPFSGGGGGGGGGGIPTVPTSSWTKVEIIQWLLDNGVTLSEPALSNLNKSELLDLVEDVLTPA